MPPRRRRLLFGPPAFYFFSAFIPENPLEMRWIHHVDLLKGPWSSFGEEEEDSPTFFSTMGLTAAPQIFLMTTGVQRRRSLTPLVPPRPNSSTKTQNHLFFPFFLLPENLFWRLQEAPAPSVDQIWSYHLKIKFQKRCPTQTGHQKPSWEGTTQ